MDISASSDELDTSIESLSSIPEGQTLLTLPQRPSPFTLRSQCASSNCPQGTGILFRSRISPSPSKTRVRSRRRRRSDQSRLRNLSDSSSFLEISHHRQHDPPLQPLAEYEHIHHHHHQNGGYHHSYHHEDYPSDGIHNIDHHHVHIQDKQLHMPSQTYAENQHMKILHPLEPLQKEIQQVRFEDLKQATAEVVLRSQAHSVTRADILFEEFQKEEAERLKAMKKRTKKRTVTTSESTTTRVSHSLADSGLSERTSVGINGGVAGIAETVKNTVIGLLTPAKEKSYPSIVESSESGFEDGSVTGDRGKTSTPNERYIPAREFFAEADTRERLSGGYFSRSDTPSKLRESTRRLSVRKPYNKYIAYSSDEEYDDWKQQPKTDYTYSASLTYRKRVTPDRKIGSPNMSRRTLKGGNINYVGTSEFSASESSGEDSNSLNLRSRTIHKAMDGLSGTGDGEENFEVFQNWSRRSSRSPSYDITRTNGSLTRTMTTTTTSVRTTRTLHTGLDAESDVDDGTESALPLRATPLTARSGTPVGRSVTPVAIFNSRSSSSRRSSMAVDAGKGYNLRESAIAEDLEEEEIPSSTVVMWSRKTWRTITRITTIITASIAMAAASAVTASSKDDLDMPEKKTSRFASFTSTVSTTKTRVVTTLTEKYTAVCEHLRKNPIWLWIPLLFLLLLLALIAHWLLLQSRGKTAGATDPTENDGSSFFAPLFLSAYDLASSLYSGITSLLVATWVLTADSCIWLASACYGGLVSAWAYILGMFNWLGSLTITCVAFLLQWLFTFLEFLQYCAMAVLGFFTSSASTFYGLFAISSSNETVNEKINSENNSWGIIAWASKISPVYFLSETYVKISEGVQSSGTVLWNGWLWLVLSMGELLSALAGYTMSLFSMIWYALAYLVTGLWTVLTYIFLALIGFFSMAATTISSVASNTSAAVATSAKMIFTPLFASRDDAVTSTPVMISKPQEIKTVEDIVQQSIHYKGGTVDEIVKRVLESEELKGLIATAVAESSREQITIDIVSGIAKSVVERELGILRAEIKTDAEASAKQQNDKLKEEKELLIMKLQELGQRLYNVEGKIEVADKRSVEERQENEEKIKQILQQIKKLEEDHTDLAMDVKSCCEDKNIPAVLGEIFGLVNITEDGNKVQLSSVEIGAWLKSYFVAKEELDNRLNGLMATMQLKTAADDSEKNEAAAALTLATVEQTKQLVMDTVLEKLRLEMKQQQISLSEEAQKQISEQINLQVKAAAGILGEQVLDQVQLQVQNQKQQLSESLKINVDSAVQEAMTGALPKAVDSAVETAVNSAVEKAVSASVDIAVTSAVKTAVPAAVNEAVPQAVKSAVPEAVSEVLPNVVAEQVATAVPEVVASVLPAAVSSAVNETVTTAVSEAIVQVNQNTKKEIVGIVGTTSTNISHDNGSLFAPEMHLSGGLNETAVIQIVNDALKRYDADKTGMVDHALESAGGNIVSTRCTESYQSHQAEVLVFGFPIYRYSTNNPRSIIQPDTMPGQCWAFKGSQGYIVIQLAGPVKPTGFTMEHIPKSLSPNGAIDSAPREFEVWGLASENDEGVFLGLFEYKEDGHPWQFFSVTVNNSAYFPYVELKINSNHGNLQYTCLYRFRVHGLRQL